MARGAFGILPPVSLGLSGTGRMTYSADAKYDPIGGDEQVQTSKGVFKHRGCCTRLVKSCLQSGKVQDAVSMLHHMGPAWVSRAGCRLASRPQHGPRL